MEPTDTVVVGDEPLMLDCVANYTGETGTHAASVQWLKDSQPIALSPPRKYELLALLLLFFLPSFNILVSIL